MPKAAPYRLGWDPKQGTYILHDTGSQWALSVAPDSHAWLDWLASIPSFTFRGQHGQLTLRQETRSGGTYWYAYRRVGQKMTKRYLVQYRALAKDKLRSPEERLDAIVDEAFEALTGPGSIANAFALHCWSLAETEAFVRDLMMEVIGEFQDVFSGLVAKINPSLPSGECTLRGALILSHLQGLMVFTRRAGDNAPDLDALRAATKVVWKALSTASQ